MAIKYNFDQIFLCLKQFRFLYKYIKFLSKPNKKQLFERQLVIVVQYFLPHVSYSVINTLLDYIVQEVQYRIKSKYPKHSIFSTLEHFSIWRDNNIYDNFWNPTEEKQIMIVLEEYVFSNFHKLYQLLMISYPEMKYLNSVSNFILC